MWSGTWSSHLKDERCLRWRAEGAGKGHRCHQTVPHAADTSVLHPQGNSGILDQKEEHGMRKFTHRPKALLGPVSLPQLPSPTAHPGQHLCFATRLRPVSTR